MQCSSDSSAVDHPGAGRIESGPVCDGSPHGRGGGERSRFQPWGSELAPALQEACDQRLSRISWFRTDWQRGGALTGYADYSDDAGRHAEVVVKLPVPPAERLWMLRLQSACGEADEALVPRIHAHGETLGGYDMAWLVMERLPHGPLGPAWGPRAFDMLVTALGHFQRIAAQYPLPPPQRKPDWSAALEDARQHVRNGRLADAQRWKAILKKVSRRLDDWVDSWEQRPMTSWCHGDLHLGNAMSRSPAPEGQAVLIDWANVHPGYWVEDAVYAEHLYWGTETPGAAGLCSRLAKERKRHDLPREADWAEVAELRRLMLALSLAANRGREGSFSRLNAALTLLERRVG